MIALMIVMVCVGCVSVLGVVFFERTVIDYNGAVIVIILLTAHWCIVAVWVENVR